LRRLLAKEYGVARQRLSNQTGLAGEPPCLRQGRERQENGKRQPYDPQSVPVPRRGIP
jgi:hypothetical protein